MSAAPVESGATRLWFRLPLEEIAYVRFIVEAYEGLAQVTSERRLGEMEWVVPDGRLVEARELAAALREEVGLVPIEPPPPRAPIERSS
jgi:hypothetical protein